MHVCRDWRGLVLTLTRLVVPRIFARQLTCSVSLLMWQRVVLGRAPDVRTLRYAAGHGDITVLRLLCTDGCTWDWSVLPPQEEANLLLFSTFVIVAAAGMLPHAMLPHWEAILLFCNMRATMVAPVMPGPNPLTPKPPPPPPLTFSNPRAFEYVCE